MKKPPTDLDRYCTDLMIIRSHIGAALSVSIGLYQSNPLTHGVPDMEDLSCQLESILGRLEGAIENGYDKKS